MEKIGWKQVGEKSIQTFEQYLKDPKWKQFNKTAEVKSLQLDFADRTASRGQTQINVSFETVVQFLKDQKAITHIDKMLEKMEILQQGDGYFISHLKYKGIFPASARDFVTLTYNRADGQNRHLFGTTSVDYKRAEQKGTVRATVKCAGYEIVKNGQNKTKVTYISDADPAGSLPGFIKTMVSKGQTQVPVNLKKYLQAKKK